MAYERATDTTKPDQNTSLLADSLDAAVNGAIATYNEQVTASDNEQEANFQALVAGGTMTLAQQLTYRQNQLKGTLDTNTRATIRTQIATLKAQVSEQAFSDAYTTQLQQNAAGTESIQNVISWLQGQLSSTTDVSVQQKINSELVTWNTNLFNQNQKTLSDQTTYAKGSGNMTIINNQLSTLQAAQNTALLNGDEDTAANLGLQIQDLQNFVTTQTVTQTMQNLATGTTVGSTTAIGLLDAYNNLISSSDNSTPVTISGTTYSSLAAFYTQTRDAYVSDTSSSGLLARVTKEDTDLVATKNSNNTLSNADLTAINAQFKSLAANPLLQPFAAQLATAQQTALQTAGDALATVVSNNFDQDEDLNKAVTALTAIQGQGVNVDATMQKILTAAAQTNSQAVSAIMKAASDLMAANPGLSIASAVSQAIASGAATNLTNNALNGATPAATATAALTADANGTATATSVNTPAGTSTASPVASSAIAALPDLGPGSTGAQVSTLQNWLIGQGYSIPDGATGNYGPETTAAVAAYQKANGIDAQGNDGYFGPITKSFVSSNPTTGGPVDNGTTSPSTTTPATPGVTLPTAGVTTPPPPITPSTTTTPTTAPQSAPVNIPTAPTTSTTVTTAPTVAGTPAATGTIDYTLHPGETIDEYNARIAAARAAQTYTPPPPVTTNFQAGGTSSPASTPAATPTSTPAASKPASTAPATLTSSSQYAPPTGLTQSKTNQGGTAYTDASGNLYVQSSPGVYTLNNSLK